MFHLHISIRILKVSDGFSNVNKPTVETATVPTAGGGGGFAAYAKINPFASMGPPMGFGTSSKTTATSNTAISNITTKIVPNVVPVASTSPKPNPFGASNPAHNPFMNFVAESKPNVDYWQKFKEPVKVPASDAVSSSDVKVTFVNPSKQQNEGSTSAFTGITSASKSSSDNSTTTSSSSTGSSTGSSSSGSVSSNSISQQASVVPAAPTQSSEDNDEDDEEESEETDETSSSSVISEKKPAIDTAAMFHKPIELDNGEAGEECVLKLRAKLYRLSEVKKESASVVKEWMEVGTGPVRLLTPSASASSASTPAAPLVFPRIVMRREHQAGGPGTIMSHILTCLSHPTLSHPIIHVLSYPLCPVLLCPSMLSHAHFILCDHPPALWDDHLLFIYSIIYK